eukprot:EG_transcript_46194
MARPSSAPGPASPTTAWVACPSGPSTRHQRRRFPLTLPTQLWFRKDEQSRCPRAHLPLAQKFVCPPPLLLVPSIRMPCRDSPGQTLYNSLTTSAFCRLHPSPVGT